MTAVLDSDKDLSLNPCNSRVKETGARLFPRNFQTSGRHSVDTTNKTRTMQDWDRSISHTRDNSASKSHHARLEIVVDDLDTVERLAKRARGLKDENTG